MIASLDAIPAAAAPDEPLTTGPPPGPVAAFEAEDACWVHQLDPGRGDGPRLAVKDLVAVAGLPVHAGSLTRRDAPPEPRDAEVVATLRAAGFLVAGTVALHELAFGVTGINDGVGFPSHPEDWDRIPGGSSSGSAVAVARGWCDLAIGTDTGGSVRIPAALCGVIGFKPRWGRYSVDGVLPLAPTQDHVGFLARSVAVVARAHQALTGDTVDLAGPPPRRIGVDQEGLAAAQPAVASAVEGALRTWRDRGCELVDVELPTPAEVLEVSSTILIAEAAAVHRDLLTSPAADLVAPDVIVRLRAGTEVTDADYRAARAARTSIAERLTSTLAEVDVVAGPTIPLIAPTIAEARADHPGTTRALVSRTRLGNLTGVPAISLPLRPAHGLPVGLQLLALHDATLLGFAAALEQPAGPERQDG